MYAPQMKTQTGGAAIDRQGNMCYIFSIDKQKIPVILKQKAES